MQDKQLYNRLYQSYKRRSEGEQIKNNETMTENMIKEIEQEKHCKKFEMYIKEIKVFFEERLMESVEEEQKQQKKIERIITKEEQVLL